ncbi:MAG: hypothetical protein WC661_11900 [Opitutaceae bacterium]|jgi:hypothetical protein
MSFLSFLKPEILRPGKTVRVKMLTTASVSEWSERTPSHREPGDVLEVTKSMAALLVDARQAQILGHADKRGVHIELPKGPEKTKSAPVPAGFSNLPVPFTKAWELYAKLHALNTDYSNSVQAMGNDTAYWAKYSHLGNIVDDAQKAVDDFRKNKLEELGMFMMAAGNANIAKAQLANELTRELADVAFQIFKIRVSDLGISEGHARRLFAGSALSRKYASFSSDIYPGHTVFLGGNDPRQAVEEELEPMVCYYNNAAAHVAKIEPLLKEARTELEAAQGVVSKNKKAA